MKKQSWSLIFYTVLVVLASLIVGVATYDYAEGKPGINYKLGVDLVGGTILVYEMDLNKFENGQVPPGTAQELAASLKRRIDPSDLYNVTIRPVSETRVEIILPTGGQHQIQREEKDWKDLVDAVQKEFPPKEGASYSAPRGQIGTLAAEVVQQQKDKKDPTEIEQFIKDRYSAGKERSLTGEEVERVKDLIKQVGLLEFRILAQTGPGTPGGDDREGIEAARKFLEETRTNPARKADLAAAAAAGKPPLAPREAYAAGQDSYSYSWTELGKDYRFDLGLSNEAGGAAGKEARWGRLEAARQTAQKEGKEEAVLLDDGRLYYSRQVPTIREAADGQKRVEYFVLTRDPERGKEVTGKYLRNANADGSTVHFSFDTEGGDLFGELTGKNKDRYLAIVLDGQIMSAPVINSKITTDGEIKGQRSKKETDTLVTVLRSGKLPASLKQTPVSENTMGSTLGADTIRKGAFSVILAFVAILVFMVVYYRFSGMVACAALLVNLLLTVAIMVLVNATFTLPGLAGLVLMLGMAVDANVLIYERLREERERGASITLAIRNGYDRALPTIIDTHLSSIFTAIVLYAVGNDQLRGFGISLALGLVISLLTSLLMTKAIFNYWLSRNWITQLRMLDLKHLPVFRLFLGQHIDFMRIRNYWFTATVLLTIFGITVFVLRGEKSLNIDFVGGTAYTGTLTDLTRIGDLRNNLSEEKQADMLKVAPDGVKQVDTAGRIFEVVYAKGDPTPSRVYLHDSATPTQLAERVSKLPDYSVEQIFVSGEEAGSRPLSQGDQSRLFTVRTSEKEREIVDLTINRLLGDKLDRIALARYEIVPDTDTKGKDFSKRAVLEFHEGAPEADSTRNPRAFASPAQVLMLLQREFTAADLENVGLQAAINRVGNEEYQGRFPRMSLELPEPVSVAKLKKILDVTQTEFARRPQPERLENFDSQLAAETQTRALYAILASWAAILLYLWFRFGSWTFGMAAVLCLVHDLFFTLGIIAFCHYLHAMAPGFSLLLGIQDFKIDLPTVAALLTLVGYSVNDTIVVFDRIREVRGKNPLLTAQMINDGVNQTLSRTLLTSFSVWLVVIVLYLFGGEGVHLFAFVMVVGVVVGTYSSIYIASPLLLIFGEGAPTRSARDRMPQKVGATV